MDLDALSEDQMDDLMQKLALAKMQKQARRTPDHFPRSPQPPEPEYREQTPPTKRQASNDIGRASVRSTQRDVSCSEDLETLDDFYRENIAPDLSQEEWLYVSPVFRHSELQKRMRVVDWLRIGSEDEFDDMPNFNPARRTEYRQSPSPTVPPTRYKSPTQLTFRTATSPLVPQMDTSPLSVDILKITTTRSRYVEEMERRQSLSSPPARTPTPQDPADTSEHTALPAAPSSQSDWTRTSTSSPQTPLERMTSPRQLIQDPHGQYESPRQSPSPKLTRGPGGDSSLQRVGALSYRRSSPSPHGLKEDRASTPPRVLHSPGDRGQLIQKREFANSSPETRVAASNRAPNQSGMRRPTGIRPIQGLGRPRTLQQPSRYSLPPPSRSRPPPN